ncbi:HNH endonuclease [Mycobacterium phage Poenanya]|uniref:HNH endonuclease n=1 Tax=Mycobacterium phage Poenanya TaxID=2500793 RepID=A0A411AX27_9CAUD|nr:HNH endonuclease [Mycobacterium phage Poenanya]QAX92667.1 HNH endonuclease [Mycobacterium phage Poenanya]QFP96077.1 HNH endonuclease [Mycobacterium phage Doomphist]
MNAAMSMPQTLLHTIAGPVVFGGSRRDDTNVASNGLWACGACHRWAESYRTQSFADGWLVRQSQSPITVPVLYRGNWVLLDDDGFVYRIPNPVEATR